LFKDHEKRIKKLKPTFLNQRSHGYVQTVKGEFLKDKLDFLLVGLDVSLVRLYIISVVVRLSINLGEFWRFR
jgi:hypothetical protein